MDITYSHETSPLGTGGALVHAADGLRTSLVLNGDTYIDFDLPAFYASHLARNADITVLSKFGSLKDRGEIVSESGRIAAFNEKQNGREGLFSTGAYIIEKRALDFLAKRVKDGKLSRKFSMEKDGFPLFVSKKRIYTYITEGDFFDMGTLETLVYARKLF